MISIYRNITKLGMQFRRFAVVLVAKNPRAEAEHADLMKGNLLYAGDGQVRLTQASTAPSLFETLPPRNHEEWLGLGQQLETHRRDLAPGDLKAMAAVLRLNRTMDRGLAHAVVGYTDALVETLLNRRGVPIVASQPEEDEVLQRLEHLEDELTQLRGKSQS